MPLNLPNLLTWLRIVLIPLFVGIFYFEKSWVSAPNQNLVATILFTAAAVTDWLDGWLARKLNQTSAFGEFLDPVAVISQRLCHWNKQFNQAKRLTTTP